MSLVLSKHNLLAVHDVDQVEFAREAFRAVIANGKFGFHEKCMYRTPAGDAACAIGVCLTDEQCETLESHLFAFNSGATADAVYDTLFRLSGSQTNAEVIKFLAGMQTVHDNAARKTSVNLSPPTPAGMFAAMKEIATDNYTCLSPQSRATIIEALNTL